MRKLLLALLVLLALPLQAQEYTSRYFHYNQWYDAPPPFQIAATTTDGADNNLMLLAGGGAADISRGAYVAVSGNEAVGYLGKLLYIAGDLANGEHEFFTGTGRQQLTIPYQAANNVDLLLGIVNPTAPIYTIRGQTLDGDDDGTLMLTPAGAMGSGRGGRITVYGNEVGVVGGRVNIAAGNIVTGDIVFRTSSDTIRWTINTTGDIIQSATDGGNFVMTRSLYGLVTGIAVAPADFKGMGSSEVSHFFFGSIPLVNLRGTADTGGTRLVLAKSRKTDGTADTVVQNGDTLGQIYFEAADGTDFEASASISVITDGTPGNNDVPGAFVFAVSPDGTRTPEESLRISQNGGVLVKGVLVAALPATCSAGAFIRSTDSNDCVNAGGDGALCVCNAAGNDWILSLNY